VAVRLSLGFCRWLAETSRDLLGRCWSMKSCSWEKRDLLGVHRGRWPKLGKMARITYSTVIVGSVS